MVCRVVLWFVLVVARLVVVCAGGGAFLVARVCFLVACVRLLVAFVRLVFARGWCVCAFWLCFVLLVALFLFLAKKGSKKGKAQGQARSVNAVNADIFEGKRAHDEKNHLLNNINRVDYLQHVVASLCSRSPSCSIARRCWK